MPRWAKIYETQLFRLFGQLASLRG
jgi:hypothetical protein